MKTTFEAQGQGVVGGGRGLPGMKGGGQTNERDASEASIPRVYLIYFMEAVISFFIRILLLRFSKYMARKRFQKRNPFLSCFERSIQ